MRTIKFRGKSKNYISEKQRFVYGSLSFWGDGRLSIRWRVEGSDTAWKTCGVISETVGQFIGIVDRNGKEIYEGDIITVKGDYPRVVLWDKMMWALMPTVYYHDEDFWVMNLQHPGVDWWEEYADEIEVIGNIYDNPKMLQD